MLFFWDVLIMDTCEFLDIGGGVWNAARKDNILLCTRPWGYAIFTHICRFCSQFDEAPPQHHHQIWVSDILQNLEALIYLQTPDHVYTYMDVTFTRWNRKSVDSVLNKKRKPILCVRIIMTFKWTSGRW